MTDLHTSTGPKLSRRGFLVCTGAVAGGLSLGFHVPLAGEALDRKSTRLNSSHVRRSYASQLTHSFPTRRSSDLITGCSPASSSPPKAARSAAAEGGRHDRSSHVHRPEAFASRIPGRHRCRRRRPQPWLPCPARRRGVRSEEHTSELQSRPQIVCLPTHTLFPYTTLFRSYNRVLAGIQLAAEGGEVGRG